MIRHAWRLRNSIVYRTIESYRDPFCQLSTRLVCQRPVRYVRRLFSYNIEINLRRRADIRIREFQSLIIKVLIVYLLVERFWKWYSNLVKRIFDTTFEYVYLLIKALNCEISNIYIIIAN